MMQGDGWQQAYELSVDLTVRKLREADLGLCCRRAGAKWHPGDPSAEVVLLGNLYRVLPPKFDVVAAGSGEPATIWEKILILHYLENASGTPITDKWITFGEVPGGHIYLPVFNARSTDRVVRAFRGNEHRLIDAAREIGGEPSDMGDDSVAIRALPNVPILLVLWSADDELPAAGSILFDSSVTEYLPMEDVVVLAGMVASRLHP